MGYRAWENNINWHMSCIGAKHNDGEGEDNAKLGRKASFARGVRERDASRGSVARMTEEISCRRYF